MSDEIEKSYPCNFCQATFQKEIELERHNEIVHTQSYTSKPGEIPKFKSGSRKHRS